MFQHVCCCITINSLLRDNSLLLLCVCACVQWSLSCKHTLSILPSCPPFLQVSVTILPSVKSNTVPLPSRCLSFILLLSQTAALTITSVTRQFKCQTRLKKIYFYSFQFSCAFVDLYAGIKGVEQICYCSGLFTSKDPSMRRKMEMDFSYAYTYTKLRCQKVFCFLMQWCH